MKFCWCTIYVNDLQKSVEFYTKALGLKVVNRVHFDQGPEIAFLAFSEEDDETQVELFYDQKQERVQATNQISLGFNVDSLQGQQILLRDMGLTQAMDVIKPSPYIQFFYVEDPNGLKVQFVEKLSE